MIELTKVTKAFKNEEVLKETTIEFEKGKITGIVGRNGSGKTVLMKIICGLLKPTTGTVVVNGQRIGKDVDFPGDIGIIIETPIFVPYQSAMTNLKNLAAIRGKIKDDRIREVIRMVGLNPDDKKRVGKFSLGMRQRLGIAQAIMEDPELLILDEPFNGLDKQGAGEVCELLRGLKERGKTILIAAHNMLEIEWLCDTICEMDAGVLTQIK